MSCTSDRPGEAIGLPSSSPATRCLPKTSCRRPSCDSSADSTTSATLGRSTATSGERVVNLSKNVHRRRAVERSPPRTPDGRDSARASAIRRLGIRVDAHGVDGTARTAASGARPPLLRSPPDAEIAELLRCRRATVRTPRGPRPGTATQGPRGDDMTDRDVREFFERLAVLEPSGVRRRTARAPWAPSAGAGSPAVRSPWQPSSPHWLAARRCSEPHRARLLRRPAPPRASCRSSRRSGSEARCCSTSAATARSRPSIRDPRSRSPPPRRRSGRRRGRPTGLASRTTSRARWSVVPARTNSASLRAATRPAVRPVCT